MPKLNPDMIAFNRGIVSPLALARTDVERTRLSAELAGRIESVPVVSEMVQAQRQAARAEGCAFFDTFMAMGGEGSAGRWFRQSPRLIGGDLGHLTASGHIVVGEMFYRALMEAYVAYRREHG